MLRLYQPPLVQRQRHRKRRGMFINIYWPPPPPPPPPPCTSRASLPSMSKQQLVEGASGWRSGDSSRQRQMLASAERKCSLTKRRAAVWAEGDNERLAAYLLHCPWGEVITMSMVCVCVCVCVWEGEWLHWGWSWIYYIYYVCSSNIMTFGAFH